MLCKLPEILAFVPANGRPLARAYLGEHLGPLTLKISPRSPLRAQLTALLFPPHPSSVPQPTMTALSAAFVSPLPQRAYLHALHHRPSPLCLRSSPRLAIQRPTRPRTLCVAQEKTQPSPPPQTPPEEDPGRHQQQEQEQQQQSQPLQSSQSPITNDSDTSRQERARKARLEAERLELMAAKARLDFERAEIQADRKRLELEKAKTMREIEQSRKNALPDTINKSTVDNPYDKESTNSKETTPTDPVAATAKVGSGPTKKVSASSLSDLLSAEFPRVAEKDIELIKEKLCGMDTFFVTEVDRSPFDERVVFRGNLRMSADNLLDELETRSVKEGISDRVRLFLLVDPKDSPDDSDGVKRPVVVALPSAAVPDQTTLFSAVFSVVVGLAAFATTFSYGIGTFGLTPQVISEIARGNVDEALLTLPVSVGVIVLALLHDVGHRVMGKLRNVKLGPPFFIPSLQIGNFGIITPLESYPKLRSNLFDVAAAGPIVGLSCSFVALVAGLIMTSGAEPLNWFPQVPSALFHASILVGSVADLILPAGVREQATVAVHPLTMVGYTGLLVNALNLMPIGRLDGGRIVQALYGRVAAGRATALTLLVQGVGAVIGNSPLLLFWGLVCVLLQRESDIPCLNEVLEPDNARTAAGLTLLVLMLVILVPYPGQISDVLGKL